MIDNKYTVVVVDNHFYMRENTNVSVDIDMVAKSKNSNIANPVGSVYRSFWITAIEAILEFQRVCFDIFFGSKFISLLSGDTNNVCVVTDWSIEDQSNAAISKGLIELGPPKKQQIVDISFKNIVDAALKQLHLKSKCGRVIFLTSIPSQNVLIDLKNYLTSDALSEFNKVFIDIVHIKSQNIAVNAELNNCENTLSSGASYAIHVTDPGSFVCRTLLRIALEHFDLACTVVKGIPMKEEQQANISNNYDVELLHEKAAHTQILAPYRGVSEEAACTAKTSGLPALSLSWLSPKQLDNDNFSCLGTYRLSPIDVNSRHSMCLTNFLLNGRSVTLEIFQSGKSGSKLSKKTSQAHVMSCHGGEIYLHVLSQHRSPVDTLQAISEGVGGAVTDYRIVDFMKLVSEFKLEPFELQTDIEDLSPQESHFDLIDRKTRYWPITSRGSLVKIPNGFLEKLSTFLSKAVLSDADCAAVQKMVNSVTSDNILPATKTASNKKDEQYRQMWTELEEALKNHADLSPQHRTLVTHILDSRIRSTDNNGPPPKKKQLVSTTEMMSGDITETHTVSAGECSRPSMNFIDDLATLSGESLYEVWKRRRNQERERVRVKFEGESRTVDGKFELYTSSLKVEPTIGATVVS